MSDEVDDEIGDGVDGADADALGDEEEVEEEEAATPAVEPDLSSFQGRLAEIIVNAAAAGNVDAVRRLMNPKEVTHTKIETMPVDPNSVDARGTTALMWAVRKKHTGVFELLLDRSAAPSLELDARDKQGRTALHWAVWERRYAMLRQLLARGAARDVRDHNGRTPLCCAADMDDARAIATLLDARADADARDAHGRTALLHSVIRCSASSTHLAESQAVLELLLRRGADVNVADDAGQTPLIWCAQHNKPTLLQRLAATGECDTERQDHTHRTALDHASGIRGPGERKNGGPFCATLLVEASEGGGAGARCAERHSRFVETARARATAGTASQRSRTAHMKARVDATALPRVRAKLKVAHQTRPVAKI